MSNSTTMAAQARYGKASKRRRLITTDSHIAIPFEVADELPEKYRRQVPHLERRANGTYLMRPDIANMMSISDAHNPLVAGIKVDLDDEASMARLAIGNSQEHIAASLYPKGRLAEMEKDGVVAEVLLGKSATGYFGGPDPDVSVAWCKLNNDWYADTYKDYFGQFAPSIWLPVPAGVDACVKELERAAGLGLRPVLMPEVIREKPWYLREWEPLWEACAALKVPFVLHVSGTGLLMPWVSLKPEENPAGSLNTWIGMAGHTAELLGMFVNAGILERHPDLQVVFTELHAGWLAWAMHLYDHYTLDPVNREQATSFGYPVSSLKELPSYYIKRQVKCSFLWDPMAIKNRHETGLDCLMWSNDYPHTESMWPDSQVLIEKQFAGVPEDEITKLVHDNAAKLYGFTV
ncbi:amidohydrolase family protein [Sorangium sp. So ce315]|uniref:amidohydrolase family protein n=1 Tax=Sorangium sp. So ce315 TaxID=3133299 RepID=UPI003F63EB07